jgi:hypothetical protein
VAVIIMSLRLHPGGYRLAAIVFIVAGVVLLTPVMLVRDGHVNSPMLMLYFLSPYLVPLLLLPFARLAGATAGCALGILVSMAWLAWTATAMAKANVGMGAVGLVAAPLISLTLFMLPGLALGLFADWYAWRRSRQP